MKAIWCWLWHRKWRIVIESQIIKLSTDRDEVSKWVIVWGCQKCGRSWKLNENVALLGNDDFYEANTASYWSDGTYAGETKIPLGENNGE